MLILATVVINVGTGEIKESRRVSFVSYMQAIQSKVDFIVEYDEYTNYGQELSETNKNKLQNILNNTTEDLLIKADLQITEQSKFLRYFDSSDIADDLEIENIDDEIVVDFNTREVISLNGIEYEDKMYYTQYKLPGGQSLKYKTEEVVRNLSIGTITANIDGLNATFTIGNIELTNGTLSYGKMDTSDEIRWTKITNYTKSGESITTNNITESGTYYFKLVDNVTGQENKDENGNYFSVELRLTNKPRLESNLTDLTTSYNYSSCLEDDGSINWAFATDKTDEANLKYYVWIPRYAYMVDSNGYAVKDEKNNGKVILEFLRGTSDITSSGSYISTTQDDNGNQWTIPDEFTKEGVQKTGVWVQVSEPKQSRYKYN